MQASHPATPCLITVLVVALHQTRLGGFFEHIFPNGVYDVIYLAECHFDRRAEDWHDGNVASCSEEVLSLGAFGVPIQALCKQLKANHQLVDVPCLLVNYVYDHALGFCKHGTPIHCDQMLWKAILEECNYLLLVKATQVSHLIIHLIPVRNGRLSD